NAFEGAPQPKLAAGILGTSALVVGGREFSCERESNVLTGIDCQWRCTDATVRARPHDNAFDRRQGSLILHLDERLRHTNQATVSGIVNIQIAGLTGVNDAWNHLTGSVLHWNQYRGTHGSQVPDIVGHILQMEDILARVEIH